MIEPTKNAAIVCAFGVVSNVSPRESLVGDNVEREVQRDVVTGAFMRVASAAISNSRRVAAIRVNTRARRSVALS